MSSTTPPRPDVRPPPPIIKCRLTKSGTQVYFTCPYCRYRGKPVVHYHGSCCIGHRWAHCHDPSSPYKERGYVLELEVTP